MLPNALEAMDQPTMDGINTYVVSKAVKEAGVTVALSGLGGDELFAGYPSFRRAMQLHRLAIAPSAIRQFASTVGRSRFLTAPPADESSGTWWKATAAPYAAYAISRQLFSSAEIASLLTRGQMSEARGQWPAESRQIRNSQSEIRNWSTASRRSRKRRLALRTVRLHDQHASPRYGPDEHGSCVGGSRTVYRFGCRLVCSWVCRGSGS